MSVAETIDRADAIPWDAVSSALDAEGWALLPQLLSAAECDQVSGLYDSGEGFPLSRVLSHPTTSGKPNVYR